MVLHHRAGLLRAEIRLEDDRRWLGGVRVEAVCRVHDLRRMHKPHLAITVAL